MSDARISAAVRECLDQCYASSDPLACWSTSMSRLWGDTSWNKADVEQVHIATRRILQALLVSDESGELNPANERPTGDAWSSIASGAQQDCQ